MINLIKSSYAYQLFQKINPQILQTVIIGSLLIIGGRYFGFVDISWLEIFVILLSCVLADYIFRFIKGKPKKIPLSAINSGIGLCLFLRTSILPIYIFAAVLAIFSKHAIQIKGRHFLNPSYTGILAAIMLFPIVAYVNPLQWQEGSWVAISIITILGSIVMLRVGLFDIVIAYFASFYLWIYLFTSHSWEDVKILFFTGSFFILTFHGLTDPAIIPRRHLHRVLYVLQISILFFVFRLFFNENYSFFIAYFAVNLLEILFWYLEKHKIKSINARTIAQSTLTLLFFLLMFNTSYNHAQKYNGTLPELLTNRCIQPICDKRELKRNLQLLKPFFLFDKDKMSTN